MLLPGAHSSINLPEEYHLVKKSKLLRVQKEYSKRKIPFTVTGVNCVRHREENGNAFWLLTLLVKSESLERIREKLGLERRNSKLNHHITIREQKIIKNSRSIYRRKW